LLKVLLRLSSGIHKEKGIGKGYYRVVWGMWVLIEIVAMATDLAEFLGAASGFNLLLGIPLTMVELNQEASNE